jgi:hypothetical protein
MDPFDISSISSESRTGWYRILDDYTNRKLTMPDKDKFAALDGVVEQIQIQRNDHYIFGMFRSDIPIALLWWVKLLPREKFYSKYTDNLRRAPSWSWASQDYQASFKFAIFVEESHRRFTAEIIEVSN